MAFTTEWVDTRHVLSTTFSGKTSVSEINLALLEYLGALQEQTMYFVMDFSQVTVPNDLLKIPALLQVINHANTRWFVLVKNQTSSSYMTKLLTRDKVKTVRSREDALAFLNAMLEIETGSGLEIHA